MTPTPEQSTIIDAARTTSDNLLISALAGAAKTSTLVMIAEALPTVPILCLAFNKKIAVEMQDRLPGNCEAMTLNSLGHRVWGQAIGRRLVVDTRKNYTILSSLIDTLSRTEKDEAFSDFAFLLRSIEFGKTMGYVPDGTFSQAKPILDDQHMYDALEEEPTRLQWNLIKQASFISIKDAWQGKIDFSDQILMPAVFPVSFPNQHRLILVDEAQDLSELNHVMVRKLVRTKRIIAVGDACQSIYAFRGAHQQSMDMLHSTFSMHELPLSVSFRCPERIVREAWWRAPHMRWVDWLADRPTGTVETRRSWSLDDLPEHTTILCRNNAPLFSMAIRLLKSGRYAEVVGNDIGKNLIKIMKKFGPLNMARDIVYSHIEKWTQEKLKKTRREDLVHDQAACLRVFADQGDTLNAAIAYAEHILNARGPITLMTIHKSKGLEFDHVIILDRHLIRLDRGDQQERNILYVAQTRTKDVLWYAQSEDWS